MLRHPVFLFKVAISAEIAESPKLKNLYVIPSASSSFIWYGVIFVKEGFYENGIFRFTLFIRENFDCPRVIFNPVLFHPQINNESGELDLKNFTNNWKKTSHLYQLLVYVKNLLNQAEIDVKNAFNKEAAKLYENDLELFKKNVKETIDECNRKIYEPPPINVDDPHAIRFSQLSEECLDKVKINMLNSVLNSNQNDSSFKSSTSSKNSSASSNNSNSGSASASSCTNNHNNISKNNITNSISSNDGLNGADSNKKL